MMPLDPAVEQTDPVAAATSRTLVNVTVGEAYLSLLAARGIDGLAAGSVLAVQPAERLAVLGVADIGVLALVGGLLAS